MHTFSWRHSRPFRFYSAARVNVTYPFFGQQFSVFFTISTGSHRAEGHLCPVTATDVPGYVLTVVRLVLAMLALKAPAQPLSEALLRDCHVIRHGVLPFVGEVQ